MKWYKKNAINLTQFGARPGTDTGEVNPPDRKLANTGEVAEGNALRYYAAF